MKIRIRNQIECPRCSGAGWIPDGNEIREYRVNAGLPMRAVAKQMGVSISYVADLELGRRKWSQDLGQRYLDAVKAAKEKA